MKAWLSTLMQMGQINKEPQEDKIDEKDGTKAFQIKTRKAPKMHVP